MNEQHRKSPASVPRSLVHFNLFLPAVSCTFASPIRALAAPTAPPVCIPTPCHIRAS
ncbi:hypothetical protein N657DRAFT_645775 [Parathielavia appendiculata]|uniref:Uncharacterized protein n=1 Tax=Parathielavia appendiculata TaxID=2587402 RepID=A0AAN6Z328_9PEZI|nr:hypothetical protein N657DRAFT_645775 [Parathielavia appendiculata]